MAETFVFPLEQIHNLVKAQDVVDIVLVGGGRIRGKIVGLDEYMNLIVEEGGGEKRGLVKGDCVLMILHGGEYREGRD